MSQGAKTMSKSIYIAFILVIGLHVTMSGQNIDELRKEQQQKQDDISYTNKLLSQTGSQTKSSLNQLKLLNKKIRHQETLIHSINKELELHDRDIQLKEAEIDSLRAEVDKLKKEYSQIIASMYKNSHDFDSWLFILSSTDFNQAYRRLKYLEQYSSYRKKQVGVILQKDSLINLEVDSLRMLIDKKTESVQNLQSENGKLLVNKKEEDKVYQSLKERQNELKKELARKQREAAQIKKMMDKILAEEKKKKAGNKGLALTPDEVVISGDFARNIGKIPWPTLKGEITTYYGEQPHPVLRGIKVFNTGIDIITEEGAQIRSIFDGEVRDVWSIKGKNMAVIIKHGEYYSVYQNLIEVKVNIGDRVDTKQVIGTIYTNKQDDENAVLHFEIWKGSERMNPENWLAR